MSEVSGTKPARRSHVRTHLGGPDVAWTFEPIFNSPSEWNVTARWMDYKPTASPAYDILDAMLIADEIRWRAAELIALLHNKERTVEQTRRVLTLCDGIHWMARALATPRYTNAAAPKGVVSEGTEADCRHLADLTDDINARIRQATNAHCEIDARVAEAQIAPLVELGELARTLYMRWYGEAGYGL